MNEETKENVEEIILPKLSRKEGELCGLQNLMPQFKNNAVSNIYTQRAHLSGLISLPTQFLLNEL
jgi:hypothetical protein